MPKRKPPLRQSSRAAHLHPIFFASARLIAPNHYQSRNVAVIDATVIAIVANRYPIAHARLARDVAIIIARNLALRVYRAPSAGHWESAEKIATARFFYVRSSVCLLRLLSVGHQATKQNIKHRIGLIDDGFAIALEIIEKHRPKHET